MKNTGNLKGKWRSGNKELNVKLPLIAFNDSGSEIVYCPALDVSGYGDNETEAMDSFLVSLGEFFLYTTNKGTLLEVLHDMGWHIRSKHKTMYPPEMSRLLSDNDNFSRIFNSHPFRKFDREIAIPAQA